MPWSRPESTLPVFPVALRWIFLQIGSLSCPRGPREQWEATSLCGSQPPMRSASLFSHCHFRISTHSSHIPPRPPPYWSALSQSSSSSHFFLLTICLNDSITLTLKVWSICLRMRAVMLSCFYIEFSHIFHIKAFYHPLITETMQLLAPAKRQLLSAHPSYEAKESIHPSWIKKQR